MMMVRQGRLPIFARSYIRGQKGRELGAPAEQLSTLSSQGHFFEFLKARYAKVEYVLRLSKGEIFLDLR